MIWGPPPNVEGFDKYREFMERRGLVVRQVYHPPTEDYDGEWVVVLERRERLSDGRVWFFCQEMTNEFIEWAWEQTWGMQADLLLHQRVPSDS